MSAFQMWLAVLIGWLGRQEREAPAYLIEENRVLRAQLGGRRLRLTDDDRRRLAVRAFRLGRQALRQVATIVTPDTSLRWHRQLVACKWTHAHRVGRSTIARILKAHGLPPVPDRPTSWRTFLRAHGDAISGADFFTTEVWTWRGLMTVYTVFVIHIASRRVQILGSTAHPNEAFMRQVGRTLTMADADTCRVLICDRDTKWSGPIREILQEAGIRIVQTPFRAPNANAHAERFVRSIKEECLDRIIPLGERHFRRAVRAYVAHYHLERNHQGIGNALIVGAPTTSIARTIRRRPRLGGLLNYYERAA